MDTTSYLPSRPSMNTFFVRHVAHPKRMVTIEGLNRAAICSVNDDGYLYGPIRNQRPTFPPNNFNEAVINSNASSVDFTKIPKKREKLLPPLGRFQPYGIIEDTDRWKDELSSLAAAVGLLTEEDVEKQKKKQEREKYIKSLEQVPAAILIAPTSPSKQPGSPKKPSSSYSKKTSRLNEELNTGRRTSRGSLASRSVSSSGNKLQYVVDENEREVWMLQVLCQILQTDSLVDVQSWLVSSSGQEKDKVKGLIDNAMKGLQASGRIENTSRSYMTPQPTNVPSVPIDAESQVNLDQIQNMIEKMRLKTPVDQPKFSRHSSSRPKSSGVQNVLKISDTPIDNKLEAIPENEVGNVRIAENDHKAPPLSPVFNINIFQGKQKEEPSIKVDSPTKDYKIEELKVTMLVKDEKSNKLQKIENNWKPEESIPKI